jgi:RHS repeat-associated protein
VEYDVYGASAVTQHNGASPTGNRFLFTGREQDAETGLYHYRARAYDPYLGRFLQCGINPLTAKEINGKKISTATSPPTSITITESSTLVLEK